MPSKPAPPAPVTPLVAPPRLRAWKRIQEETIGSFRVFEVRRIHLEDGHGHDRGHAFTLHGNDWCNVIAITPADEIVLVWQYRFGSQTFSLEIPGGVVDTGEEPSAAALRELLEETGYEADRAEPLLVIEPNPALQANRCHTFVARNARATAATRFDPMEELETVLFPAARIGELLDSGQVTHALVQGALEAYWRKERR